MTEEAGERDMATLGAGPGKIPFETHLARLTDPAKSVLIDLRDFVRSLGPNVVEDVRPHRIVYSKTMNFRIFLDVEPAGDSLQLSIRQGRSAPAATVSIKTGAELEAAKIQIGTAYEKIQ